MEPIITYEGYQTLQDPMKSRDLLTRYYQSLGYLVIKPRASGEQASKEPKPGSSSASDVKKD